MKNGPYNFVIPPIGYTGKLYRGRYAYEHHVNFWKWFGYSLKKGWEIHHRDHNHRNNHIDNLQLVTSKVHRLLHGLANTRKATMIFSCARCGKNKSILKSVFKSRFKHNKYGPTCSRRCGAIRYYDHNMGSKVSKLEELVCHLCKKLFKRNSTRLDFEKRVKKTNMFFCSPKCGGNFRANENKKLYSRVG